MVVLQFAQTVSLLLEFFVLFVKLFPVRRNAHANGDAVAVAVADAFQKELLDGDALIEEEVGSYVGIAETSRREVAVNAIFPALQQRADGQHGTSVDVIVHELANSIYATKVRINENKTKGKEYFLLCMITHSSFFYIFANELMNISITVRK